MKASVVTLDAAGAGDIDLPDAVFGLEPRSDILQRMVRYQLAKRQAGTHCAKGRAEINRSGAKLGKQKGSGRARHGSRRAPQFRGGGKAHGPTPRSHAIDLPKKVRALALKMALSAKVKSEELIVLDKAEALAPKTGALRAQFAGLGLVNALIIDGAAVQDNFALAARNIPDIDVLPIAGVNVYDILRRQKLVLTRAAVAALEERFK